MTMEDSNRGFIDPGEPPAGIIAPKEIPTAVASGRLRIGGIMSNDGDSTPLFEPEECGATEEDTSTLTAEMPFRLGITLHPETIQALAAEIQEKMARPLLSFPPEMKDTVRPVRIIVRLQTTLASDYEYRLLVTMHPTNTLQIQIINPYESVIKDIVFS